MFVLLLKLKLKKLKEVNGNVKGKIWTHLNSYILGTAGIFLNSLIDCIIIACKRRTKIEMEIERMVTCGLNYQSA